MVFERMTSRVAKTAVAPLAYGNALVAMCSLCARFAYSGTDSRHRMVSRWRQRRRITEQFHSCKMVNTCCVKNCHNRQNRERDRRYFSIPIVIKTQGKQTEELTSRRRREWVAQLSLKKVTFDSDTTHKFVCSDHFVNGK